MGWDNEDTELSQLDHVTISSMLHLELSICQRPGTTCLALSRPVWWHPTASEIAGGASTGQLFVRILRDKGTGLLRITQHSGRAKHPFVGNLCKLIFMSALTPCWQTP